MKLPVSLLVLSLFFPGTVFAADIARLEWGSFIVEADTSNGWDEYKVASSDDGRSITMTFAPLEAKADGATLEASNRLYGHYDVIQPDLESFSRFIVSVEGHVIKSGEGITRLTITVGQEEKIIEWPAGQAASEKFSRNIEFVLPANGRMPNPLKVGVQAYARKNGQSDAAYVSVDSLTITAGTSQLASN